MESSSHLRQATADIVARALGAHAVPLALGEFLGLRDGVAYFEGGHLRRDHEDLTAPPEPWVRYLMYRGSGPDPWDDAAEIARMERTWICGRLVWEGLVDDIGLKRAAGRVARWERLVAAAREDSRPTPVPAASPMRGTAPLPPTGVVVVPDAPPGPAQRKGRFSANELALIDAARGERSRGDWVRAVAVDAGRRAVVPPPVAKSGTRDGTVNFRTAEIDADAIERARGTLSTEAYIVAVAVHTAQHGSLVKPGAARVAR
jgi:hypothetical protein